MAVTFTTTSVVAAFCACLAVLGSRFESARRLTGQAKEELGSCAATNRTERARVHGEQRPVDVTRPFSDGGALALCLVEFWYSSDSCVAAPQVALLE